MSKKLTFLILGDLHGHIPTFHREDFDAIICPGDICSDDIRKAFYNDKVEIEENYEEISLQKGREVLEYLNSFNKPVFLVPGNWDQTPYGDGQGEYTKDPNLNPWEKIKQGLSNIHDVEFTKIHFNGLAIVGHGSTSAPEPLIIGDLDEHDLANLDSREMFFRERFYELDKLMKEEVNPIIFISHNSPYGTTLDLVQNEKSYANGEHYGSGITRVLIDENQPLLSISGHIHEGVGQEILGKTTCINSGFKGDINVIVEIDIKNKTIDNIEFLGMSANND